jgi:hypothetical protein
MSAGWKTSVPGLSTKTWATIELKRPQDRYSREAETGHSLVQLRDQKEEEEKKKKKKKRRKDNKLIFCF